NTPPLLLGTTLLFWGWQTGMLPVAVIIAVVLEGSRLAQARWEFSQIDLDRIWNLCMLLCFGLAAYAFAANEGVQAVAGALSQKSSPAHIETLASGVRSVFLFFQWLPLCFVPMMVAQAWSQQERMLLSTFSLWLRRKRRLGRDSAEAPQRDAVKRSDALHASTLPRVHASTSSSTAGLNVSYP